MANTEYNDIAMKILTLIKNDSQFSDITAYFLFSKTLEDVVFPVAFITKTTRATTESEMNDGLTDDVLDYQVEVYYKGNHGYEDVLNLKDIAMKKAILADSDLSNTVVDAKCVSSTISSLKSGQDILTILTATIRVIYEA